MVLGPTASLGFWVWETSRGAPLIGSIQSSSDTSCADSSYRKGGRIWSRSRLPEVRSTYQ